MLSNQLLTFHWRNVQHLTKVPYINGIAPVVIGKTVELMSAALLLNQHWLRFEHVALRLAPVRGLSYFPISVIYVTWDRQGHFTALAVLLVISLCQSNCFSSLTSLSSASAIASTKWAILIFSKATWAGSCSICHSLYILTGKVHCKFPKYGDLVVMFRTRFPIMVPSI